MDLKEVIPPQFFLRKGKISANILQVVSPSSFVIKEAPSVRMSKEATAFFQLEINIDKYYKDRKNLKLLKGPKLEELVIVQNPENKRFCRAQIRNVSTEKTKINFDVYLVDYGKQYEVEENRIYTIRDEFRNVPFQAVEFALLAVRPLTLDFHLPEFNLKYAMSDQYDASAVELVDSILKDSFAVEIEVIAGDNEGKLYGRLHVHYDSKWLCLNDYLVEKEYACIDVYALKDDEDYTLDSQDQINLPEFDRESLLHSPSCTSDDGMSTKSTQRYMHQKELYEHFVREVSACSPRSCADSDKVQSPNAKKIKQGSSAMVPSPTVRKDDCVSRSLNVKKNLFSKPSARPPNSYASSNASRDPSNKIDKQEASNTHHVNVKADVKFSPDGLDIKKNLVGSPNKDKVCVAQSLPFSPPKVPDTKSMPSFQSDIIDIFRKAASKKRSPSASCNNTCLENSPEIRTSPLSSSTISSRVLVSPGNLPSQEQVNCASEQIPNSSSSLDQSNGSGKKEVISPLASIKKYQACLMNKKSDIDSEKTNSVSTATNDSLDSIQNGRVNLSKIDLIIARTVTSHWNNKEENSANLTPESVAEPCSSPSQADKKTSTPSSRIKELLAMKINKSSPETAAVESKPPNDNVTTPVLSPIDHYLSMFRNKARNTTSPRVKSTTDSDIASSSSSMCNDSLLNVSVDSCSNFRDKLNITSPLKNCDSNESETKEAVKTELGETSNGVTTSVISPINLYLSMLKNKGRHTISSGGKSVDPDVTSSSSNTCNNNLLDSSDNSSNQSDKMNISSPSTNLDKNLSETEKMDRTESEKTEKLNSTRAQNTSDIKSNSKDKPKIGNILKSLALSISDEAKDKSITVTNPVLLGSVTQSDVLESKPINSDTPRVGNLFKNLISNYKSENKSKMENNVAESKMLSSSDQAKNNDVLKLKSSSCDELISSVECKDAVANISSQSNEKETDEITNTEATSGHKMPQNVSSASHSNNIVIDTSPSPHIVIKSPALQCKNDLEMTSNSVEVSASKDDNCNSVSETLSNTSPSTNMVSTPFSQLLLKFKSVASKKGSSPSTTTPISEACTPSNDTDRVTGLMESSYNGNNSHDETGSNSIGDSTIEAIISGIPNAISSDEEMDVSDDKEEEKKSIDADKDNCIIDCLKQTFPSVSLSGQYKEYYPGLFEMDTDLDFSDHSFCNERYMTVLQIGGKVLKKWCKVEEANFVPAVKKTLQEIDFWGPSPIQTALWPALSRSVTTVAISPQRSGKTVGYLLPLLSNLIGWTEYKTLPESNGPVALILCSSWKKLEAVNSQAQLFRGKCHKLTILTLYNDGVKEEKKLKDLSNGCCILIATPPCFLQYFKKGAVNLDRCCHVILDDGNDLIKNFAKDELPEVMHSVLQIFKKKSWVGNSRQFVLCAERWNRSLGAFVQKYLFYNTVMFFTSFLEAAIYAKIPMAVHICEEEMKMSSMMNVLKDLVGKRIVICCINSEVAYEVHENLYNQETDYQVLIADEGLNLFHLETVKRRWNASRQSQRTTILIITDAILLAANVCDAHCIIHYDLPELSRLQFSYRFGCITDRITQSESIEGIGCHILFTENCRTQALGLVKIFHHIGLQVPLELKRRAVSQKQVIFDSSKPLCHYLKSLGSCPMNLCPLRHVIREDLDHPSVLPWQGDVHVIVTHIFDATHFYVKILEYIDPVTKTTVSKTGEYASLTFDLQDYFTQQKSLNTPLDIIEVDMFCCIREDKELYHRVKVLSVGEYDPKYDGCRAKLLYIDEGWMKWCKTDDLFALPDKFCQIPPFAFEVYLCNVKPSDHCPDWNILANNFMYTLAVPREIHAKIVLCLGNTLFFNPAVIRTQRLQSIHDHVNLKNLSLALKSEGFAVSNEKHLRHLFKACENKVKLPKILKSTVTKTDQNTASWAFLDTEAVEKVFVPHIETPHHFYVQKDKTSKSLDKLLDDISSRVQTRSLRRCKTLQIGTFCLAPLSDDGSYNRAEVLNLTEENGEVIADLRFVDFGDCGKAKKFSLYEIPNQLLLLPFQAIECELSGINPPPEGWSATAIDAFFDFTRTTSDELVLLRSKVLEKVPRAAGGYRYVIELLTWSKINVSKFLISEGFADAKGMSWVLDDTATFDSDAFVSDDFSDDEGSSDVEGSFSEEEIPGEKDAALLMYGIVTNQINPEDVDAALAKLAEDREKRNARKKNKQSSSNLNSNEGTRTVTEIIEILPPEGLSLHKRTPSITWWNDIETVTVTIHIPNIEKYDLATYNNGFKFETTVKLKHYFVEETFYDEVIGDETEVKCLGFYIEFCFKKKVSEKWPRLIKSEQKVSYIKHDLNHLDTDSDSEEFKIVPEIPDESELVQPDEEAEDDSSSNSSFSEEDYEPWTQMCEEQSRFQLPDGKHKEILTEIKNKNKIL